MIRFGQHFLALPINNLALPVHYVVILQQLLSNVEVPPLQLLLGVFHCPREQIVLNGLIFFQA